MSESELVGGTDAYPPPESMRPTLVGDRWAVVGGHHLVTQVAADVLARGGNAVDAGVAAGLASNVVQPDMCNFGGIASVMVRRAGDPTPYSVAGVGYWGARADRAAILDRYGGDLPPGVSSIVPGAPSAWITALEQFGTWSFADVAAGAIELATGGFPLDLRTAQSLAITGRDFAQWESSRAVYWPSGHPPALGDRLVQPALGRLLARLVAAEDGSGTRPERLGRVHDAFYRGEVARTIAAFVRDHGGYVEESDLAGFRAEVAPAPAVDHAGWRVHVTPTWSHGPVIAQALAVLEPFDLRAMGAGSAAYLHHVVEALKLAFSERERVYADPAFLREPVEDLLGPDHIDALRALIGERALPNQPTAGVVARPVRSTTAVTVVDAEGNAFAAAISDTLDGGPIIPELGILCSHRGVQSRLAAGHPNELAPGKRPVVTPSALIALRDNGVRDADVWAMACPGADVIPQAMLQTVLNVTVFGRSAQQAVEDPRVAGYSYPAQFHPHGEPDRLVRVEDRIPVAVRDDLAARGHQVQAWPAHEFDAGSVQTCLAVRGPGNPGRALLSAGADPRRSAYALVR